MLEDTFASQTDFKEKVFILKSNDDQALKTFYQKNYPSVERYVLDNNGTHEEAKDIYQEAFIAVWRNIQLDRYKPQKESSLEAYIYQIAKYKWIDYLRSSRRRKTAPLSEATNGIEYTEEFSEEEEQKINSIKTSIKLLGGVCKNLLERFYYQKESMRTISLAMNWTEATAKNNKYRCLQRLREILKTNKTDLG